MSVGIKMFRAQLRLILAWAIRWGLKWALRGAQNIFMPKNINSITIIITLEGIERINTEKMTTKRSEEYFFHQWCKEMSTNFAMASQFWLAAYIVRLFDSHFSFFRVDICVISCFWVGCLGWLLSNSENKPLHVSASPNISPPKS